MEKTPCSSCTYLVHVKVKGMGIGNRNILAVLAPYFKNSVDQRVNLNCAPCMSGDFVNNQICIQEITNYHPS